MKYFLRNNIFFISVLYFLFLIIFTSKNLLFSGTLKFHSPNSSIVLEYPLTKVAIVPNTIQGWPGRSIYGTSGKVVNIKTASGFVGNTLLEDEAPTELVTSNSNAIVSIDRELSYVSNATINNNNLIRYNSSALLTGINNNSNAILSLDKKLSYVSNATIQNDKQISWNSSAIIQCNNKVTNNSNAIVKLDNDLGYISNATINNNNLISYNSSALITGINNNNNAILSFDKKIGYVSND
ncbi:hypothetical protein L6269_01390 [Candidatus Dependentiae bacterium]|nr:hypothetical protein [Candidatus Dependentiae bacterium]